ncbi:MAG: glycogen debranching enzyme GlgX, partial [Paracoccus sp. (in: a-proteobacteria)]|nr:glycogen debranching enzyme GlgX [Paracoccus sp. (in: a-proteobacteria)]
VIAFRKAHPILRKKRVLHSQAREQDGLVDLFWQRADGEPMRPDDWNDPELRLLAAEMRMASGTPSYAALPGAVFVVFNNGDEVDMTLPDAPQGSHWRRRLDSGRDDDTDLAAAATEVICAETIVVFVLCDADDTRH